MRMVCLTSVKIESEEKLGPDYKPVYKMIPTGDRWFNLDAVSQIYEWLEQPKNDPVSVIILASGSFLVPGTPDKVSVTLNRMANDR